MMNVEGRQTFAEPAKPFWGNWLTFMSEYKIMKVYFQPGGNMFRNLVIFAAVLFFLTSPAKADPKSDTLKLYQSLTIALDNYIELGQQDVINPVKTLQALDTKVKKIALKAQMDWWDALNSHDDPSKYHPYLSCDMAAISIQDLVEEIVKVSQGGFATDINGGKTHEIVIEDMEFCEEKLGLLPPSED